MQTGVELRRIDQVRSVARTFCIAFTAASVLADFVEYLTAWRSATSPYWLGGLVTLLVLGNSLASPSGRRGPGGSS